MATITASQAEVLVYPQSAIRLKEKQGFTISDNLGRLLYPWSDNNGSIFEAFNSLNPTAPVSWAAQPHFSSLNNIKSVRFFNDGRAAFGAAQAASQALGDASPDASFLYRAPRIALLDSIINGSTLTAGNTVNHWNTGAGTWESKRDVSSVAQVSIHNTGADSLAVAITAGDIPAHRSLAFDVHFLGTGASGLPCYTIDIGDVWQIFLEHGKKPVLKKLDDATFARTFDAPPMNLQGGRYFIGFGRLFGRGIFQIGAPGGDLHAFWFLDTQEPLSSFSGAGVSRVPKSKEVTWNAAPLVVTCFNVHASTGLSVVKWCDAGGTPFTATFTRTTTCYTAFTGTPTITTSYGGWAREGTSIALTAALGTNAVDYTATLTCSADGIDTPGIQTAFVRIDPEWSAPSISPVDFRPGCTKISVKLPLPSIASGSTCTVELSRTELDSMVPTWADTLQKFSPIKIRARHQYDDGTFGSWHVLFDGQVAGVRKSTERVHEQKMTLLCLDPVATRLMAPAAMVTQRTPPLDYLIAEKFNGISPLPGTTSATGRVTDGECVQEIVRWFLGPHYADNLNATGDPDEFLPAGHPALYDNTTDFGGYLPLASALGVTTELPVISRGNFFSPAPHNSDGRSWIGKFEKDARTKFAWLRLPGQTNFCLFYGRIKELLAGRTPVVVPDSDYLSGDANKVGSRFETESRPESIINVIDVWMPPAEGLESFIPAIRMAEARLPSSDPNAAQFIGDRTKIVVSGLALFLAEDIAAQIIAQITGITHEWPQHTMRGIGGLLPGDPITFKLNRASSDSTIGLDGLTVRSEMIGHDLTFGDTPGVWNTQAWARPMTAAELAAL